MNHRLYLDIETLPAGEEYREKLEYLYKKKRKKEEEKKGKVKGDFEQFLADTSFDGAFGRILCIAYAIDDKPTEVLYEGGDEKKVLEKFWEIVMSISREPNNWQYPDYGVQFIGHNVMDFDLRFIYQRSIVQSVKPAYDLSFARYKSYPIFDTMKEWVRWSMTNIGLESIALALDIPTPKDGIDGSQVAKFHKEGKDEEICEYCKRDVDATRKIYQRMIFLN